MLNVIIKADTVLAFHSETGKEVWRRSLGVYIIDDQDALKKAKIRVLDEIVRVICPRFEILLDAATGKVNHKRPRRRMRTFEPSPDVDSLDIDLADLLRALNEDVE